MDRNRPPAVLLGLPALGFRRSALRLQDAAHRTRARQNLQRQRAGGLPALTVRRMVAGVQGPLAASRLSKAECGTKRQSLEFACRRFTASGFMLNLVPRNRR